MDMGSVNKLGGMPSGFPFVMILVGVAAAVAGAIFTTINEHFFRMFGTGLADVGIAVLTAGTLLQAVRWVCEAFGRTAPPPPSA
jgi:hypothetical protein